RYCDLLIRLDAPAGSGWGVFDKDGKRDALGTLNFITGEAVVEEIQTGESILPYSPHKISYTNFKHTLITKAHGMYCCNDILKPNTQNSSWWDGFCIYYNGVKYTDVVKRGTNLTRSIQILNFSYPSISKQGGIIRRSILLNFVYYIQWSQIKYNPFSSYLITLTQIKEIIKEERLTIRQGAILIIWSGLSKLICALTPKFKRSF
ncbi:hypothetical protein V2W45_1232380, partial [Cenococcum geophilum]